MKIKKIQIKIVFIKWIYWETHPKTKKVLPKCQNKFPLLFPPAVHFSSSRAQRNLSRKLSSHHDSPLTFLPNRSSCLLRFGLNPCSILPFFLQDAETHLKICFHSFGFACLPSTSFAGCPIKRSDFNRNTFCWTVSSSTCFLRTNLRPSRLFEKQQNLNLTNNKICYFTKNNNNKSC